MSTSNPEDLSSQDVQKRLKALVPYLLEHSMGDFSKKLPVLDRNLSQLERINKLAVDREKRLIDLKREINLLSVELGREESYDLAFASKCKNVQDSLQQMS